MKEGDRVTYRSDGGEVRECIILGAHLSWHGRIMYNIKDVDSHWDNTCTDGAEDNYEWWSLKPIKIGLIGRNIKKHSMV